MEGKLRNYITPIRLWISFANMALIFAYAGFYYFSELSLVDWVGTKIAVLIAAANLLLQIVFTFVSEKYPELILEGTVFSNLFFLFVIASYFGGVSGFLFPAIYFAIIALFFYKKYWGFGFGAVSIGYATSSFLFKSQSFTGGILDSMPTTLALVGSMAAGYILNNRIVQIKKENQKLSGVASKLTAEKSQDEAVLTAIADGVYAVDMNRNLVLLNKAAQEMTSWSEKDAVGIKCWTVMKLKNDSDISVCEKDCPALAVWNTGEAVFRNDTCFMHRKNHKRVQLSSSYAPIKDYQGKLVGAICVFRDITKEKELERLRNEFVSTASHELRTPITATEGYLSIVTDSGMCKPDPKTIEFIAKARNTLLGMSKLIKNLLSVTKIEEGKLETNVINFSIRDLVKDVVSIFTKPAEEKGIRIELKDSKSLATGQNRAIGRSLNVRADQEMIREVLNNLIENAIKFTEKGGVMITIDYDEEFATVNIEDTGMGMPQEGMKHLFEKFYRVDNSATREVGGTGLGLYITRSIVENFGGRIWVESEVWKGSKFHFTIPLSLD